MTEQVSGERILVPVEIRKVMPEDAAEVNIVYREAWMATYPNTEEGITHEDINAFTSKWLTPEDVAVKKAKYERIAENTFNSVAVVDGVVVANSIADILPDQPYNKLQTIYVLPEYHGMGVAPQLFQGALDFLGTDKPVRLEVATYNARAIHFYEKYGFENIGRGPLRPKECGLPSGKIIPEYIMVRPASH